MGLISDEQLTLNARLSLDEAALKLSQAMEAHPSRRGYSSAGFAFDNLGRFEGEVDQGGFSIQRKSWFAQTWWFIVRGDFKAKRDGVEVHVRMSFHPAVKLFAAFWYALIIYILIASVVNWIRSGAFDGGLWAGLAFGIFFYIQTTFSWAREKQKAQRFLRALYDG